MTSPASRPVKRLIDDDSTSDGKTPVDAGQPMGVNVRRSAALADIRTGLRIALLQWGIQGSTITVQRPLLTRRCSACAWLGRTSARSNTRARCRGTRPDLRKEFDRTLSMHCWQRHRRAACKAHQSGMEIVWSDLRAIGSAPYALNRGRDRPGVQQDVCLLAPSQAAA